ncbi:MAG TPA: aminoglycoside phosphotransferase family protein [Anaerolineales bacterium]|nr:aminoglycoside phosphotransferase family protein [Anaerolineales bacterium]
MSRKMHADEIETDAALVRRLLVAQFPKWAGLPIERVPSAGTDNAMYRLGAELVARLPRIGWAVDNVAHEQAWLPRLAPQLPVAIPAPVGLGLPGEGYPYPWSIYRWIEGDNPEVGQIEDPETLTRDLAAFIMALQRVDPVGAPAAGRGRPLATRDTPMRAAIAASEGLIDTTAVTTLWEAALRVPEWQGPAVWLHGDLAPGNLLLVEDRLSAVIDFSGVGVGDPAADLPVAWNLLPRETWPLFRALLGVDDATWARGRGWALSIAMIQLPYYQHTNPPLAASARYVIGQVLEDQRAGLA